MKPIAQALIALSLLVTATASACDRIEYAEVKDWKPELIAATWCADRAQGREILSKQVTAMKASYNPTATALAYEPYLEACTKQMALYERVLKNVHGKEMKDMPACK